MSEGVKHREHVEMEKEHPRLPPLEVVTHLQRYLDEHGLNQDIVLPSELLAGGYKFFARFSLNEEEGAYQDSKGRTLPQLVERCRKGGWMTAIGYPMHELVRRPKERESTFLIPSPGDFGLYALWPERKAGMNAFRETVVNILQEDFGDHVRDVEAEELMLHYVPLREFPVLSDARPSPEFYTVMGISRSIRKKYAIALTVSRNGCLVQVWRSRKKVEGLDTLEDDPGADVSRTF